MIRPSTTLETLVNVLHERGMDDIVLHPGKPISLRKGDRSFTVSKDVMAREQMLSMFGLESSLEPDQWPGELVLASGRSMDLRIDKESDGEHVVVLARKQDRRGTGRAPYDQSNHPGRRASDRFWGPYTSKDAAVAEMERLLRKQVVADAADLHLRVGEPPVLRKRGELERMDEEMPLGEEQLKAIVTSIMPARNLAEFQESSDTDFAYEIAGLSRFRANAFSERHGSAAVFRTIASNTVSADEMGISKEVRDLCSLSKGLVLVTGPTGSGKSTTMCALIDLINSTRNDHIITIEDPIEFVHRNKRGLITQRQVGVHTQSFKSALRAALREDPDVVLVGELRDLETVAIAIETAETGHLVFGTMHTATAAGTVDRIIDQFPADRQEQIRVMLAESLKGVVSQTLLKRKSGGRIAAREILLVNQAVSNLIREGKTIQISSIMQTNKRLGMVLLNDALMELIEANEVDPLEAWLKSVDKVNLAERLKVRGIDIGRLQRDAAEADAPSY